MIKVIIIDDEPHAQDTLELMLDRYFPEKFKTVAKCFAVIDGIKQIYKFKPHVVFLDIQMPQQNGFSLFEYFDKIDFEVVFTTAHKDYALKAIKHQPFDYLLKPVDAEELKICLQNLLNKLEEGAFENEKESRLSDMKLLAISTDKMINLIDYDEILYCKSDEGYTKIYSGEERPFLVSKNLKQLEERLPENQFLRVHHSFLVNVKAISRYDKKENYLYLKNGEKISVSFRKSTCLNKYFV